VIDNVLIYLFVAHRTLVNFTLLLLLLLLIHTRYTQKKERKNINQYAPAVKERESVRPNCYTIRMRSDNRVPSTIAVV